MTTSNQLAKGLATAALTALIANLTVSGAPLITALAAPAAATPPVAVSGTTISALAGCTADGVATQPGTLFPNAEVEPFLAVNPTNPSNLVAVWQQDRWAGLLVGGGSRGNVIGASFDGGATWSIVTETKASLCT